MGRTHNRPLWPGSAAFAQGLFAKDPVKKTFQLKPEGKHPDRVLDAVKHEIRQYLRRERRKSLPAGADYWDFECHLGAHSQQHAQVHVAQLTRLIDQLVAEGAQSFYLELFAKPGIRAVHQTPESEPQ